MNPDELISTLEDVAGFITTDEEGHSVCSVCKAKSTGCSTKIQHEEGCDYKRALDALLSKLPAFGNKIIPGVENSVSLSMLMPYYADLSSSELSDVEDLTKGMMRSVPIEDRIVTAQAIGHWCPDCDPELLQRITEQGIANEEARISVRNYFVFERVAARKLKKITAELDEVQNMKKGLSPLFEQLLTKKYGYERYTNLPKD